MGLFSHKGVTEAIARLKRQSGAACVDFKGLLFHLADHTSALWELLKTELSAYARVQAQRVLLLLFAVVALFVTYLALWAFLAVLISLWLGWVWAMGITVVANALLTVLLFLAVKLMHPGEPAGDTINEIRNDIQCLKYLFNRNPENSKP